MVQPVLGRTERTKLEALFEADPYGNLLLAIEDIIRYTQQLISWNTIHGVPKLRTQEERDAWQALVGQFAPLLRVQQKALDKLEGILPEV